MADKKQYLTKEKFNELTKELDILKTVKRKEVAESLEYAKSLGDLSENAEYQEARGDQAEVEDRIKQIEAILVSAEIVELHHTDKADVGSTVTIQKKDGTQAKTYKIVGSEEVDIAHNKISLQSPLGEALHNKRKNDEFSFKAPGGVVHYRIIEIA